MNKFSINLQLKDRLDRSYRICSLLKRTNARESADIMYRIYLTHIAIVRKSRMVIEVRKLITHRISNTNE